MAWLLLSQEGLYCYQEVLLCKYTFNINWSIAICLHEVEGHRGYMSTVGIFRLGTRRINILYFLSERVVGTHTYVCMYVCMYGGRTFLWAIKTWSSQYQLCCEIISTISIKVMPCVLHLYWDLDVLSIFFCTWFQGPKGDFSHVYLVCSVCGIHNCYALWYLLRVNSQQIKDTATIRYTLLKSMVWLNSRLLQNPLHIPIEI